METFAVVFCGTKSDLEMLTQPKRCSVIPTKKIMNSLLERRALKD